MVGELDRVDEVDLEAQQLQWEDGRSIPDVSVSHMALNAEDLAKGIGGHAGRLRICCSAGVGLWFVPGPQSKRPETNQLHLAESFLQIPEWMHT